jgi:lysophospholipase L1-like esterase
MKKVYSILILFFSLFLCSWMPVQAQEHRRFLPLVVRDYCAKPLVFSAFGDSITSCYFDSLQVQFPDCGYPRRLLDRLAASYHKDFAFYNNGVGGEGTDGGWSRFQATLDDPALYCVDPIPPSTGCFYPPSNSNTPVDLVIILEGINDLGSGTPYYFIEADLRAMVQTALLNGKKVILATILPVTSKPGEDRDAQAQRVFEFNPRIVQIALDYQIPLADLYSAFINTPDWENTLITGDGLHPNDAGFELMAEVFFRTILPGLTPEGCYPVNH